MSRRDVAAEALARLALDERGDTNARPADDESSTPAACEVALDSAAFAGPLGEIVQTIAPATEAAPAGILLSLLVAAGALIGRGPHQVLDGARHGTNLFALLVGPSADGRKGTAVERARAVLTRLDPDFAKRNVASGLSSGQGVIYHLRDPLAVRPEGSDAKGKDAKPADPGVTDKRLLILENEMSGPLRQLQGRENTLSAVLRDAWDGHSLRTLTRNNALTATDPHLSVLGQITPGELRALVTGLDFTNGLLNRFLFCYVERARLLPHGADIPDSYLAGPVRALGKAIDTSRTVGLVSLSDAAAERWAEHYQELTTGRPGRLGDATRRGAPIVRRLAMIYALAGGRRAIEPVDLAAALAVWGYSTASAALVFGTVPFGPLAERFRLALLGAKLAGLDRSALRGVAGSNNLPSSEITKALQELRDAGVARVVSEATGGRARELWRHIQFALPGPGLSGSHGNNGRNGSEAVDGLSSHSSHYSQAEGRSLPPIAPIIPISPIAVFGGSGAAES